MLKPLSLIFFILFSGFCSTVNAQTGIAILPEKNSFLLGEPIRLSITVKGLKPDSARLPDSLGHFEILDKKPIKNSTENGLAVTTQELVITSFDSGRWQIPAIAIHNSSSTSTAFDLEVMTLPTDSIKPYGEIKELPNLVLPMVWWQYWWVWAGLIFLIGLALWFFFRKKKTAPLAVPATSGAAPFNPEGQLSQLKAQWEAGTLSSLGLGNGLAEVFRQHMAGKGIFSQTKTGEELILLSKSLYPTDQWQQLAQALRLCNALRFGKFEAAAHEGNHAIDVIKTALYRAPVSPTPPTTN